MNEKIFEPELTAFTCIYCGYMSADTASALRVEYPLTVKLIKFPCTGKIDTRYLLEAFEKGADGVYVVACTLGNCHHVEGNKRALARVNHTKQLIEEIGLEGERLDIFFLSGGQGVAFGEIAEEMTERVRALGPNPLKKNGHG